MLRFVCALAAVGVACVEARGQLPAQPTTTTTTTQGYSEDDAMLLQAVLATGTPTIVVLVHGRPVSFGQDHGGVSAAAPQASPAWSRLFVSLRVWGEIMGLIIMRTE